MKFEACKILDHLKLLPASLIFQLIIKTEILTTILLAVMYA